MRARSALFDLYGDHLRPRGGRAPVAALVRLLEPVEIAAPAVRTAVSRMVRQGWLTPVRLAAGPGYALTARAVSRLDDSARRIYRTGQPSWDGTFDMIITRPPTGRSARTRLLADLAFLGYGRLNDTTWTAPHASTEVPATLAGHGLAYHRFTATPADGHAGAARLVGQAWDLRGTAQRYTRFIAELTPVVDAITADSSDRDAYAARFQLVHQWRAFLFRDPHLPHDLLPTDWPGTAAAGFFDTHAGRLRRPADRFVDACLASYARQAPRQPPVPVPAQVPVPVPRPASHRMPGMPSSAAGTKIHPGTGPDRQAHVLSPDTAHRYGGARPRPADINDRGAGR